MRRPAPRLNRLPQRLDYTLIPAPLDLSLPLVDEKAALPAIIVTPSSPSHETDFAIAFLAPPAKPSLCERVTSRIPSLPKFPSILQSRLPSEIQLPQTPAQKEFEEPPSWTITSRARTAAVFAILLFIMACHLVMHSMITGHPHFEFGLGSDNDMVALNTLVPPVPRSSASPEAAVEDASSSTDATTAGWLNLHAIWAPVPVTEGKRNAHYVISDDVLEN
ncbi:hypothetical protein K474DRAFT_1657492 [Panus rudis PR-1116 ss-1]|nr:hypothetical protein K474DRAFT_1657492 [Panus rudis PR-1116 ss-1]